MATREELFYIGRDNTIDLLLMIDRVIQADLSNITRMILKLGAISIDSDLIADALDWTSAHDDVGNDKLVISLAGIVTTELEGFVTLIVFDAANPNGIVWISPKTDPRLKIKAFSV